MTTDDADSGERIERLRRTAYGRTITPDDERAAAAARHELEALSRAEQADGAGTAAPAAAHGEPEVDAAARPAAEPLEPTPAPGSHPRAGDGRGEIERSRGWLLPAVVGLVVGAVLGGTTLGGLRAVETVPQAGPSPTFTPGSGPLPDRGVVLVKGNTLIESGPGVASGALRWFAAGQSETDLYGDDVGIPADLDVDMTSTRLVHTSSEAKVWVAMTVERELCLLVQHATLSGAGGACVDDAQFDLSGITVKVPGSNGQVVALWDGLAVTVATGAP